MGYRSPGAIVFAAVALGLIGLVMAILGWIVAMAQAGAGHGWISPIYVSLAMFPLWPLVLVRIATNGTGIAIDRAILIIALVLDLLLILMTLSEGTHYFLRALGDGVVYIWLVFWLGWQFLAVAALTRRMNIRAGLISTEH